jgi:uncharacterized protein YutE (UPF0331/DUF86 family)
MKVRNTISTVEKLKNWVKIRNYVKHIYDTIHVVVTPESLKQAQREIAKSRNLCYSKTSQITFLATTANTI